MMIIGIIVCILITAFIIAVYRNVGRDYEAEESERREAYYENIRKMKQ